MGKEEVLKLVNEYVSAKDRLKKQLGYIGYNGLHMTGAKLVPVMKELGIAPTFGRYETMDDECGMYLHFRFEGYLLYCWCSYLEIAEYGYLGELPGGINTPTEKAAFAELRLELARLEAENKRLKEERGVEG